MATAAATTTTIMTDRDILPDDLRPSHYSLSIRDLDFTTWKFKGTVAASVRISRPTREITLNAHQLTLRSAVLTTPAGPLSSTTFTYDTQAHRVTISLPAVAAAAAEATVAIEFEGILNNELAGFYRAKYKPVPEQQHAVPASVPRDDEWHYMFSTQFEACDARRAFPCWDEPAIKATFDFEIEIPDGLVALSNMPVKEERQTTDGRKTVSFERTPVMSTYLLAWAVGDFEYIEAKTERRYGPGGGRQLPVRVYTTRGRAEQGRWALEHTGPIIDYFSELFGIDYPLPKADLLAVHEFSSGAMENWGLITYRTTAVLFDEKTSDMQYRNRVAYVVAHELVHQWFGNLVTMAWWDELWLNEGFATWVGWHAIDRLHPEWDVWSQFLNEGMSGAFDQDGMRSSHPIHVPVRDALEVDQIFDAISYRKGCAAIRMLADHIGLPAFFKGVGLYLRRHAYGNATTADLWAALSEVTDGQSVAELMAPWISRIGYPVVTVAEEPGQISVRQARFLSTGDVRPEEDETVWWIPLSLEGKRGVDGVAKIALQTRETTIRDVDTDDFYKLNSGAPGFYRVNYPPPRLLRLGTQLDRLSVADKIATIGSARALAHAGYGTTAALLSFMQGFRSETSQVVWSTVLAAIGRVKDIFGEDEVVLKALKRYTLALTTDAVARLGMEFHPDDDYMTVMLRRILIDSAATNGNEEISAKLLRQFNDWAADPEANQIHPSLRRAVYKAAIRTDPARAVSILKREWATTQSIDGKSIILSALGTTRDDDLIRSSILPFLYATCPPAPASESVPAADMCMLAASLGDNRHARRLQWEYLRVKGNWDAATQKIGNNMLIGRFVIWALDRFVHEEDRREIEEFFATVDTKAFDRNLAQVLATISAGAMYRERDAKGVRDWLAENGYVEV